MSVYRTIGPLVQDSFHWRILEIGSRVSISGVYVCSATLAMDYSGHDNGELLTGLALIFETRAWRCFFFYLVLRTCNMRNVSAL